MSKDHLEDVLAALEAAGWVRLSSNAYEIGSPDPFTLEGEKIKWGLRSETGARILELEFHAFGDLGQRTAKLRDIFYCIEPATGRRLYFEKRTSALWIDSLSTFVASLGPAS